MPRRWGSRASREQQRAEEMRASAAMVDATGVGGVMAGAAAQRQSGVAAMRARQVFAEPTALKPWRERADEILGDSQRKR